MRLTPIFTTVGAARLLMIMPDVRAEMDGHPILTYDYHIYIDKYEGSGRHTRKAGDESLADRMNDSEYMGYITFEEPGKMFTYQGGPTALDSDEVQEVIEIITNYRDNKKLWQV